MMKRVVATVKERFSPFAVTCGAASLVKTRGKTPQSQSLETRSCPFSSSFFSCPVVITRLPVAAPRLVIKVPPTPLKHSKKVRPT